MPSLLAVAFLLTTSLGGSHAPAVPDLSGTWVLQIAESDFGMVPPPDSRVDVFDHQEPRLTVKRTTSAQGTTTVADMNYVVDGQPHRNMAGSTELVSTLRWDGDVLVMVTTTQAPQGELVITDRYALSADGRTLTQARVLAIQDQTLSQTMILRKQ